MRIASVSPPEFSPNFVPLRDADQDDSQEFFRFATVAPVPAPAPASLAFVSIGVLFLRLAQREPLA